MAVTSGFFDSVSGDRTYDAEQMSSYFEGLISDGVYESVGDRFLVSSANSGMNITVGTGRAIIQSHWVKNDSTATLTLDPSDVQFNRLDAVVLRLDKNARSIELVIKKGTGASGTPSLPAITRSETVYELYLAAVLVNKNAAQPTSVTDLRPSSYCGWVTGIVQQVDTSDLFTQYENAYSNFYESSTSEFEAYFAAKTAEFNAFMTSRMTAFEEWYSKLTAELTVETGLVKYQNTVRVIGNAATIGIAEYDPELDILFVYVNGVFFVEGLDYTQFSTMDGRHHIHKIDGGFRSTDDITFIVLKNQIGKSVIQFSNAVQDVDVSTNSFLATATDFEEV